MWNYDSVRARLYALAPRGIVLGLSPMREVLGALNDPQERLHTIHVAGTNGKGSVSAMVAHGLMLAGHTVGLYTSPHLHRFAERFRINGTTVDDHTLVQAAQQLFAMMDARAIPELTFFEATTALAWIIFSNTALHVDRVVLEVGLGGRLDATNVCRPSTTAITRIAMDHQEMLGDTLQAIAREKAGILKQDVACVLGASVFANEEALDSIRAQAIRVGAPLCESARVISQTSLDSGQSTATFELSNTDRFTATLALHGEHQVENAALAAEILSREGVATPLVQQALETVVWGGRLERIENVWLDAAHNLDGVQALLKSLSMKCKVSSRCALVFGVSADKDWRPMLDALSNVFPSGNRFYCAAGLRRALAPSELAKHREGAVLQTVREALHAARNFAGTDGLVVVCGSIFVLAEARAELHGIESDPPIGL